MIEDVLRRIHGGFLIHFQENIVLYLAITSHYCTGTPSPLIIIVTIVNETVMQCNALHFYSRQALHFYSKQALPHQSLL
jgi:hypothetical protein